MSEKLYLCVASAATHLSSPETQKRLGLFSRVPVVQNMSDYLSINAQIEELTRATKHIDPTELGFDFGSIDNFKVFRQGRHQ